MNVISLERSLFLQTDLKAEVGFSLFGLQENACGIGKGDEQWNCKVVGLFVF